MKITEEKCNDVTVCIVEGEIKITTSPDLRKDFDGLIKRSVGKIVVDLTGVGYVDSSGLATLIEMFQRLKKTGGHMRFFGLNQKVRSLFEITKLHKLFDVYESREEALKHFV